MDSDWYTEDMVFLPVPFASPQEAAHVVHQYVIQGTFSTKLHLWDNNADYLNAHGSRQLMQAIRFEYDSHCHNNHDEPEWIHAVPMRLRAELRSHGRPSWHDCEEDIMLAPFRLPYSSVNYCMRDNGVIHALERACDLWRITDVRQLGNLSDPTIPQDSHVYRCELRHRHTRYVHVMDVQAVLFLIGRNNNLSAQDILHLRTAGVLHDALTPAHGDTTKLIDPEAFDEDANVRKLFTSSPWKEVRKFYNLDEDLIADTIQGRGLFGELLDITDKLCYVARDACAYMERCKSLSDYDLPDGAEAIRSILEGYPNLCDLWEVVVVQGDRPVFTDGLWLGVFLRLRALLFKYFYFSPNARYVEYVLAKVMINYLYVTKELTSKKLLEMRDEEVDRMIGELVGTPWVMHQPESVGRIASEEFDDLQEARRREQELIASGNPLTLIEHLAGKCKPSTQFLVRSRTSSAVEPFSTLYSAASEIIRQTATLKHPVQLYYIPDPQMKPETLQKLLDFRKKEYQLI